jgi:hypothetical protein
MDRDVEFAKWILQSTRESGLATTVVDGQHTIAQNAALAAQHLRL